MKKIFIYSLIIAIQLLNCPLSAKALSYGPEITGGIAPTRSPLEIIVYDYLPYFLLPIAAIVIVAVLVVSIVRRKKIKKGKLKK